MSESISLVLGSGGARGLAHIGVIQEIESRNMRIASISGCSMGALVGGIYAAGKLNEFEGWIRAIDKMDIVSLLDIAWQRRGLVKGDRIIETLVNLVGDRMIEDLPIPFTAVAADIVNEKEVWLNSGPLFDAIRASISLPLFFTPVRFRNSHLIDGGVLNPVPIAPTFNDNTDLTIAVNLGGPAGTPEERPTELPAQDPDPSLRARLAAFVSEVTGDDDGNEDDIDDWGAYDIANQAFDTMQGAIARHKLAVYPPDVLIELPRDACQTLEFERADEMIELGRRKAAAVFAKTLN